MLKQNIIAMFLSSVALSACAESTDSKQTTNNNQVAEATPISQLNPELQKKVQELVKKTKKNLIPVEGGSYLMGDFGTLTPEMEKKLLANTPKKDIDKPVAMPYSPNEDNKFVHLVTLDNFSMDAYKVSYTDFEIYTQAQNLPSIGNPNEFPTNLMDKLPAEVDWNQAKQYCQWIGTKLGKSMDLPTEAQWEYAARNKGQYILFATNTGIIDPGKNAWTHQQYKDFMKTNNVELFLKIPILGKTPPTPLGFYDLMTNNYEWMNDWYKKDYYKESPIKNPQGPKTGTEKVIRSSKPQGAENLQHGEGMTINRFKTEPKPFYNPNGTDKKVLSNLFYSFRCVVN